MSDVIRVQVVDDHRIVRRAISRLLSMEPDVEVVGEAVDELDALKQVEALAPDVVLMDVSMPRLDEVVDKSMPAETLPLAIRLASWSTCAARGHRLPHRPHRFLRAIVVP